MLVYIEEIKLNATFEFTIDDQNFTILVDSFNVNIEKLDLKIIGDFLEKILNWFMTIGKSLI